MVLSGHQPNYWPYAGLIGKIMKSDCFMYVSNVQFEKKSWQKRNRVRTKEGWAYIQVPVITKGKFEQNISDVVIDNKTDWREKNLKTITLLYKNAEYFEYFYDFLIDLYGREWHFLNDLNIYIMNYLLKELGATTKILYDKDYNIQGHKTDMLVEMCKKTGCDTYLSNSGSSAYVELEKFTESRLNHKYIEYVGQEYTQQYKGFEPNLSIIDMLMNCGIEKTRDILLHDENYLFSEVNKEIIFK